LGKKEKTRAKEELVNLEHELDTLYTDFPRGFEKEEEKLLVLEKEKRKLVLLSQEEETWRQKSRINWLAQETGILSFFMLMQIPENKSIHLGYY
jgi:hypothetical protein